MSANLNENAPSSVSTSAKYGFVDEPVATTRFTQTKTSSVIVPALEGNTTVPDIEPPNEPKIMFFVTVVPETAVTVAGDAGLGEYVESLPTLR